MDDLFKFSGDNVENVEKINLDELYEKKQEQDKNKLFTYNKILTRIHEKIKLTSRQKCNQQFCWFVVPEIILGVANYDHAGCIAYLVDKLQENNFMVRYTHPNLLLISWIHYVPNYVRTEFKKKTGTAIDEYGRPILYDEEGKVIKYNDGKGNATTHQCKVEQARQRVAQGPIRRNTSRLIRIDQPAIWYITKNIFKSWKIDYSS